VTPAITHATTTARWTIEIRHDHRLPIATRNLR
jgi:hypothetical protein